MTAKRIVFDLDALEAIRRGVPQPACTSGAEGAVLAEIPEQPPASTAGAGGRGGGRQASLPEISLSTFKETTP